MSIKTADRRPCDNCGEAIEMPGYKIDKDLFLCQSCVIDGYSIKLVDLMMSEIHD